MNLLNEQFKRDFFSLSKNHLDIDNINKYIYLFEILNKYTINDHKICLIRPHQVYPEHIQKIYAENRFYIIYIPYGLMSLAASISQFLPHWNVEISDLHLQSIKNVCTTSQYNSKMLLEEIPLDYDIYGISYMFPTATPMVLEIADYLKSNNKFVISGGVQATSEYVELLNTDKFDIIIKRESETQIVRLLDLWEQTYQSKPGFELNFSDLVNTSFKRKTQIISFEDKFENMVSLDIKKVYNKIDLESIHKYGSSGIWNRTVGKYKKYSNIMINRGCRGHCSFCSVSNFMKRGIRTRTPQDVLDEILFLYNEKGVRHIEWLDDDLLGSRKNSLELFNRLAAKNIDLSWSTTHFVLALSIDREMALAMSNSGCVMTGFGVETGNKKRLAETGKLVTHEHIKNAVSIFQKYHSHIFLVSSFIFGFPNETFSELFETFDLAKTLRLDWCANSILIPFRGSKIFQDFFSYDNSETSTFCKQGSQVYTVGRDLVSKGKTFDDMFNEVIDFRKVNLSSVASQNELKQFQIYFNVFVNLLGNTNLTSEGNPEKIRCHTQEIVKAYPMDAVSWYVNAISSKQLYLIDAYDHAMKNCEKALKKSSYWRNFFDLYDVFSYVFE